MLGNRTHSLGYQCVDYLHPFKVEDIMKLVYKAKNELPEKEVMEWHQKTIHISKDRYIQDSRQQSDVTYFDLSQLISIECTQSLTGKTRKNPNKTAANKILKHTRKVYMDVSGPFPVLIGIKKYAFTSLNSTRQHST